MNIKKEKNNIHICVYIITNNYAINIKNIIENTTDKKEIKKYTKWLVFVKYIKIIFKLYQTHYTDIHYFIKKTELLCGNSKIITQNNTLLFYNMYLPNKTILCDIKKNLNIDDIHFIDDIIYNEKTAKKLHKMVQNIYYIIYNDSVLCWQFKNDCDILKYSSSNLSIVKDKTDIYIKHSSNSISRCNNNTYGSSNKYPIDDDDISNDYDLYTVDSICSDHDIYEDDDSIYNENSYYNNSKILTNEQLCKTDTLPNPHLCNYEHEYINSNSSSYDYIYDMIKNSCVMYIYIIATIVKFYTNIDILKYDSFRRLLYIINFNR